MYNIIILLLLSLLLIQYYSYCSTRHDNNIVPVYTYYQKLDYQKQIVDTNVVKCEVLNTLASFSIKS